MKIAEVIQQPHVLYHVTPSRNLPRIRQEGLVPRLGRRAKMLGEGEPAIYLFPTMEDAETALEGWLGNQFSENTRLSLLAITLPENPRFISGAEYELILLTPIPPQNIQVISTNWGY
jgi:hypothetical protein